MMGEPAEGLTVASGSLSGRLTSDCLLLQSSLGRKSPSRLLTALQPAEARAPAPASGPPPVELLLQGTQQGVWECSGCLRV